MSCHAESGWQFELWQEHMDRGPVGERVDDQEGNKHCFFRHTVLAEAN